MAFYVIFDILNDWSSYVGPILMLFLFISILLILIHSL